jgi:hypothetical protein
MSDPIYLLVYECKHDHDYSMHPSPEDAERAAFRVMLRELASIRGAKALVDLIRFGGFSEACQAYGKEMDEWFEIIGPFQVCAQGELTREELSRG